MRSRLSLVTLGVRDISRSRAFYEALGWRGVGGSGDEPVFFQAGDMIVALWDRALRAAGATVGREPAPVFWGGYTAMIFDPDGHPWEIAHNPGWSLDDRGGVHLAQ
jgi:uncharacterized protein